MTTEEFLAELKTVADQFDWTLRADTGRHADRRTRPRLHLEASPRGEPTAIFDLLGAVCYAQLGRVYESRWWTEAGRALGLSPADSARLVAASRDRTWEDCDDGSRKPVEDLIDLREQMLDATGILLRQAAGA